MDRARVIRNAVQGLRLPPRTITSAVAPAAPAVCTITTLKVTIGGLINQPRRAILAVWHLDCSYRCTLGERGGLHRAIIAHGDATSGFSRIVVQHKQNAKCGDPENPDNPKDFMVGAAGIEPATPPV